MVTAAAGVGIDSTVTGLEEVVRKALASDVLPVVAARVEAPLVASPAVVYWTSSLRERDSNRRPSAAVIGAGLEAQASSLVRESCSCSLDAYAGAGHRHRDRAHANLELFCHL